MDGTKPAHRKHMVETTNIECDRMPALVAAKLGVTPVLLETWMRLYKAGRIHK
ncbi:hypothetical protein UL82_01035 [Corynebacterium kutscheri]|uniref:Transposase n=1 Tax=Corynebacterium kutscheri TaxID=35755 RepID=A0A0F6TCL7_9CORY|nr:hypothetical protein UL82_01035 [Corynebacterium kutscheri]VEH10832.1 Uncharacterised protein [Corynebacterium kutscheri]